MARSFTYDATNAGNLITVTRLHTIQNKQTSISLNTLYHPFEILWPRKTLNSVYRCINQSHLDLHLVKEIKCKHPLLKLFMVLHPNTTHSLTQKGKRASDDDC